MLNLALSEGELRPSGSTEESDTLAYGHYGDCST
jgi:hypothetical protein